MCKSYLEYFKFLHENSFYNIFDSNQFFTGRHLEYLKIYLLFPIHFFLCCYLFLCFFREKKRIPLFRINNNLF